MSDVPYSMEAEISILGNFIESPALFAKHGKELSPDDFFAPGPRNVFGVLCKIVHRGEVIRLETVAPLIEKEDFDTLADAIAKCRKQEVDFARDMQTVLRDSARRQRLADIKSEQERIIADPTFEVPTLRPGKSRLTFRRVSDLSAMTFDESDKYLGDRMLAAGLNSVMAGPAGIGKSRLLIQMALCCITGRDFLGMPTFAKGKRWLILQNENSNRRLQQDIMAMVKAFGVSNADIALIEDNLIVHTLEDDRDSCTRLEDPSEARDLDLAIQDYKPAVTVFDPLNTFTALDLNSDMVMREISSQISRMVKKGDPSRIPLLLHHSLTGKSGAAKAVGWDKSSFARNSKVLVAWCRSQFNIAPRDADDETLLLMSCGKCSDGKPFDTMGLRYNPATGLYSVDHDFNLAEWLEEMNSSTTKKNQPTCKAETVKELLTPEPLSKAALVKAIEDESGCKKTRAYEVIEQAQSRRLIRFDRFTRKLHAA